MEMTHDYVDLETAKLLKIKGFDCKVSSYYSAPTEYKPELTTNKIYNNELELLDWNNEDDFPWLFYSAPEHWMVLKWLRLKYNIWIEVYHDEHKKEYYTVLNGEEYIFGTPEEAELEAIKYCLNNLI